MGPQDPPEGVQGAKTTFVARSFGLVFGTTFVTFSVFFGDCFRGGLRSGISAILAQFLVQFWGYFRSFLVNCENSGFCNPSTRKHCFRWSRASHFASFCDILFGAPRGNHFCVFFVDFGVAGAPVWRCLGVVFRHPKKRSGKSHEGVAGNCRNGGGGPLQGYKDRIGAPAVSTLGTPSYLRGTVADL